MGLMFLGRLKNRIKPLFPDIKIWFIEGTQKGTVQTAAWSQTTGFVGHYIPRFKTYGSLGAEAIDFFCMYVDKTVEA